MAINTKNNMNITVDIKLSIIDELFSRINRELNEDDKNKFYSILFLCKFYEIVKDIKVLLEAGKLYSVPILLRSINEILYDLKNIEKTPYYLETLAYNSSLQEIKRIKILTEIKECQPDDQLLSQNKLFSEIIENTPLTAKKILTKLDKFKNVDGDDLFYRIVYSYLSKESHSDIISLENHFVEMVNGNIIFRYDINEGNFSLSELINIVNVVIYESIITVGNINEIDISDFKKELETIYKI